MPATSRAAARSNRTRTPPHPEQRELHLTLAARPRYQGADGYAVWHGETDDGDQVVVAGRLALAPPGARIRCAGAWQQTRFGWTFAARSWEGSVAQTADGVARWLALRLPGVGEVYARRIVEHFGADRVFEALDADPSRLAEVLNANGRPLPGRVIARAASVWHSLQALRQTEAFLLGAGCTERMLDTLFRRYGHELIDVIAERPYALVEVPGIGFTRADRIARADGRPLTDPGRLEAGLRYLLQQADSEGHAYLSRPEIFARAAETLSVQEREPVAAAVRRLARAGELVVEADGGEPRVYLRPMHELELAIAARIRDLISQPAEPLFPHDREPPREPRLTDEQWQAVRAALDHRIACWSGTPGTGKSFTLRMLCDLLAEAGISFALAAPTGKAARRVQELSGRDASTLHRLLEFQPATGRFGRHRERPLEQQMVIVDEASMLPSDLMGALLAALGPARLLLVGDPEQLPPIGAGRPFADLLESGCLGDRHVALRKVQRQAARSLIVQQSRRIVAGQLPYATVEEAEQAFGPSERDFFVEFCPDAATAARRSVELVVDQIPRLFNIAPQRTVVLAPMRTSDAGLDVLNRELESRLNPRGAPVAGTPFRLGMRLIATRNDYTWDIPNGTLADLIAVDGGEARLSLEDGRVLELPLRDLVGYLPARAISVHRFQGSEADAVVVAIASAAPMVSRSLVYTAITRARKLAVLVAEKRALAIALSRTDGERRNTTLAMRIRNPQASGQLV